MKMIFSLASAIEFQFTCEPSTPARKAAIDAMRHWRDIADLVAFAEARHGYQDNDGFFGITYPEDLDAFDKANGFSIPDGHVEAIAWYGAHDGAYHHLPEVEYLELLKQYLVLNGQPDLAIRTEVLLSKLSKTA